MKAILALCALLAASPASAQIHRWVDADGRVQYSDKPPAPAAKAAADQPRPEIRMYATDWCPHCRRAQAFFAKQGIRYTHIDIEKSEAGRAEYRSLGGRGVPLIVVGSQRMSGFGEERMMQMLKSAGY
jgi:glutaredoxin